MTASTTSWPSTLHSPVTTASLMPVDAPDGPAPLQLVQVAPHRRGGHPKLAAQVLNANHTAVADERAEVVPPLGRQGFRICHWHKAMIDSERS